MKDFLPDYDPNGRPHRARSKAATAGLHDSRREARGPAFAWLPCANALEHLKTKTSVKAAQTGSERLTQMDSDERLGQFGGQQRLRQFSEILLHHIGNIVGLLRFEDGQI